jgi:hypothetical protein
MLDEYKGPEHYETLIAIYTMQSTKDKLTQVASMLYLTQSMELPEN